jgi:hypothetical protein
VAGLPVNISLGEFSFQRFVKRLLDIEDKLYDLEEVSPELKGFVQVVSYAVDYLCYLYEEGSGGRGPLYRRCVFLFCILWRSRL